MGRSNSSPSEELMRAIDSFVSVKIKYPNGPRNLLEAREMERSCSRLSSAIEVFSDYFERRTRTDPLTRKNRTHG